MALGVFTLLALPGLLSLKDKPVVSVSLKYPKEARGIASQEKPKHEVPTKTCEPAERWRYECDENNKNCVKDRMETYMKCKSL